MHSHDHNGKIVNIKNSNKKKTSIRLARGTTDLGETLGKKARQDRAKLGNPKPNPTHLTTQPSDKNPPHTRVARPTRPTGWVNTLLEAFPFWPRARGVAREGGRVPCMKRVGENRKKEAKQKQKQEEKQSEDDRSGHLALTTTLVSTQQVALFSPAMVCFVVP